MGCVTEKRETAAARIWTWWRRRIFWGRGGGG